MLTYIPILDTGDIPSALREARSFQHPDVAMSFAQHMAQTARSLAERSGDEPPLVLLVLEHR